MSAPPSSSARVLRPVPLPRRRWSRPLLAALGIGVLLSAYAVLSPRPQTADGPSALTLDGTVLQADGERFVLAGAAAYVMPFYHGADGGQDAELAEITERSYEQREEMVARMRASGINTLRIPLGLRGYTEDVYDLGGKQAYLDRLRDVVAVAADNDIRVVVGWWDSHSEGAEWLETYREVFPMMRDVREALEPWPGVLYEPFNEPHQVTWEQWEPVMSDVVRYWREDLDYDGVLLIDTVDWSWSFDPEVAERMMDLDADLRDAEPALVFANHRYANSNTCFCGDEKAEWQRTVGQYVDSFPIAGTEYGYWNGPDHEPQDQWSAQFARHIAEVAVPAGMNGYIAFVWDWVDPNAMTEPGGVELNAYGRLLEQEIFSRHGLA